MISKPIPGQRLSSDYMGRLVDEIREKQIFSSTNTMNQSIIVAKIVAHISDGYYSWKQVVWNSSTSAWIFTGRNGDNISDTYAIELNKSTTVPADAYVYLVESDNGSHRWSFQYTTSSDALLDKLTQCCGCEFTQTVDGAQSGSYQDSTDVITYDPSTNMQSDWETLRNGVIATMNNAGAAQSEPIGGLGRYLSMATNVLNGTQVSVTAIGMTNDNCEFHFDTSSIDPDADIMNAVLIVYFEPVTTGSGGGDYSKEFNFSLKTGAGASISTGISSATVLKKKFNIDSSLINISGNTTFKWTYDGSWTDTNVNYPIAVPTPDNDSQFWQGWQTAPVATLYVLTDLPCGT